jgi:TPR repeat protein
MKKIILIIGLLFSVIVAKDLNLKELETNCNDGDIESCSDIGFLYLQGEGVKQDYQKAAELNQKSCDGGNLNGCYYLGTLYEGGKGVRQDYAIAKEYYGRACDLGLQTRL